MDNSLIQLPDDLSAHLLEEYDNEETLNLLERGAVDHAAEAFKNETEAAKYVYLILYHRLWRHRRNEDGTYKYFRDGRFLQELYLPDLERLVRWGRASIFAKFRAMKLAVNGLNLLPEQIEAYGGIGVFEVVEDEVSRNGKINPKNGKIIEFNKDTNGLSPQEYILNIVKSFSPGNTEEMRPREVRDALRNNLSDRPNIWFELEPFHFEAMLVGYGYDIRWCREVVVDGVLQHENGTFSEGDVPFDVMAEYCRRLRMKNPLKDESSNQSEIEVQGVGQEETSASPGKVQHHNSSS